MVIKKKLDSKGSILKSLADIEFLMADANT